MGLKLWALLPIYDWVRILDETSLPAQPKLLFAFHSICMMIAITYKTFLFNQYIIILYIFIIWL